jgi:predicted O-methyltransferase YrrM
VSRFRSRVAINDDVSRRRSYADFSVFADGREVGAATGVWSGEGVREIECDIAGAQLLELVATTSRWHLCHAVWLDPELDVAPASERPVTMVDPLRRAEIELPPALSPVKRCIATVASPGWEPLLDDLLGSVVANGNCPDALLVVFLLDSSEEAERIVAKYRAVPIRCRPLLPADMASKSVLYSVASVVEADAYICLDSDMVVLDDLGPVFGAIEAAPEGSVLACREGNGNGYRDIVDVLSRVYAGAPGDLAQILGGNPDGVGTYPLTVNDGIFAGPRSGLLALDATIRSMPGAIDWLARNRRVRWRNQFIFNLALAVRRCGIELDERCNLQLNSCEVEITTVAGRPRVMWHGKPVRILHANGSGRNKYPQLRGLYANVADPLVGGADGDAYAAFLAALRAWTGRFGLAALTLSFSASSEDENARVRDASVLPVLALLHYLIRANGSRRVLETGTARGVSTACLASAVVHRSDAIVVSFDSSEQPGRAELWAALPGPMRTCIEQRPFDPVGGLERALADGEDYDAALLDAAQTVDDVAAELELAQRLVRPGGSILLPVVRPSPEIDTVLASAQRAGYGVVRLNAGGGADQEAGLGLAIVENSKARVRRPRTRTRKSVDD